MAAFLQLAPGVRRDVGLEERPHVLAERYLFLGESEIHRILLLRFNNFVTFSRRPGESRDDEPIHPQTAGKTAAVMNGILMQPVAALVETFAVVAGAIRDATVFRPGCAAARRRTRRQPAIHACQACRRGTRAVRRSRTAFARRAA